MERLNKNNGLGLDLWLNTNDSNKLPQYKTNESPIYTSIFRYRTPGANLSGDDDGFASKFVVSSQIENNDEKSNNTSISSIISYLQGWKSTWVDYADFAYLKDLGVYPSNRLMIARRFPQPTPNNIYSINSSPISTMISWMKDDDTDNISITYGEVWEELRETTFTEILNNIGEALPKWNKNEGEGTSENKVGSEASRGFNIVSLPGWTEGLQIEVMKSLGLVDYESNNPPSGNPNLIREGVRRSTVSKTEAGSGLTGKFSIKFVVEYEQKYINGIDPTLVYMDIIQKCLMFGTSKSTFMINSSGNDSFNTFVNGLINGDINSMISSLIQFVGALAKALGAVAALVAKATLEVAQALAPVFGQQYNQQSGEFSAATGNNNRYFLDFPNASSTLKATLGTVISKYRIKFFSILQAMTGAPTGYWHVTVGNPKKPILSLGDLYTQSVTMDFGKVLSFNDLPSTIKITFTLGSSRNLGGQEIMDALNTGQGRTYIQKQRSYVEVPITTNNQSMTTDSIDSVDYDKRFEKFKEITKDILKSSNPGPGGSTTPSDVVSNQGRYSTASISTTVDQAVRGFNITFQRNN